MRYRSIAVWPETTPEGEPFRVGNIVGKNESDDTHASFDEAEGVCRMLCRQGFGGMGKVFPVSTRVEPVETLCWKCNGAYDFRTPACPHCQATNGNVDPDKAMAEMHAG